MEIELNKTFLKEGEREVTVLSKCGRADQASQVSDNVSEEKH
ncbi:hypothetical protein ES702_00114 [subsurface metagenome]